MRWLLEGSPPFPVGTILEVPLYSPLDCDLLGLPRPHEVTAPALLDYAENVLGRFASTPSAVGLRMLTFHDWIIASSNRLTLLDRAVGRAMETGATPITNPVAVR